MSPSISPNGERIAFTALGDLMLWEPASAKLEKLTDDKWAESSPVWSHDGTRLAYISDQGGSVALWLYDFNVGAASRVPAAIAGPSYPSFAPDGESVAVYTTVRGNPLAGQMAIVKLDDGSVVPLHQPRPPQPISWSTDSGNLVTTSLAPYSRRYREGVYQLVVANRDSGEAIEVVPTPHRNVLDLVLIPGEQAISYVQDGRMWRMQLDEEYQPAGSPVALTADVTDNPSWSATGRFVVYMSGKRMMRLDSRTGTEQDVTPPVRYARSQPDGSWTMRVGRLFDATGDDYLTDVDIVVEGNRIRDVRPAEVAVSPDIDASGYVVFPGLFEMHGHMGAESEPQGRTWLAYGITTVRDPGSNPYLAKARQESWDSGRRDGPRTHITGYLTDGNRVYYSMAEGVTSDEHLKRALARVRDLELDFIKTYVRLPDLWQKRVIEFAHSIGIPVSSHELYPAVANGSDHVEHIGGTSRRGYQPKVSALGHSYDDVVRLLADSGMGMTATAVLPGYAVVVSEQPDFFVNAQFDHFYGEAGRRSAQLISRMFGAGAAAIATANGGLLKALVEENALLVTGTDSPFVPYGAGLHAELRLYQRAGLSGAQILRSATIASARAAGVADDLGTLQVGKLADFVVVDGDPLRSIGDADNVVMTVKNGVAYALEDLLE